MAMTTNQQAPDIFQTYVVQNMRYALSRVRALGKSLPDDDEREMLLHALTFGLESPEAWLQTRQTLLLLAPKMEQAGYRGEWVAFLERGIRVSEERQDQETEAELRLQLGILLQLLSQYEDADEQLTLSLECFKILGLQRGEARVLNRQAWVARRKQRFERAEELLEAAMALLDEGDDQFAYALLVLGSVRFDQQRWQEAIAIEQKALVLWDAIGDQRMQAWIYTNLGNAYWWSKDLEQAATHLQAALTLFDKVDDPVHRAVAAMNLGGVYIDLNQPQTALIHFKEAEKTFRSSQEQLRLAHIYNNIGHAYLALDQPENAVNSLVKSLHFWEQLSDHDFWRLNTMTCLGVAHQREGNYEIAADILLQAQNLLPTINLEPQYQVLAREIAEELVLANEGLTRTQRGTE